MWLPVRMLMVLITVMGARVNAWVDENFTVVYKTQSQ